MRDPMLLAAGILGASGVILGALGAHALTERLGAAAGTWQTAVLYHLVHATAVLAVALFLRVGGASPGLAAAGWLMAAGVVLFSGSLYLLSLDGPSWLGPITPLGGVAFITGWALLAVGAWRGTS